MYLQNMYMGMLINVPNTKDAAAVVAATTEPEIQLVKARGESIESSTTFLDRGERNP